MAKLSISLPNDTLITLECEEPELVHEVLGSVLQIVQRTPPMPTPVADAPFFDPWTDTEVSGITQQPAELHRTVNEHGHGNGVEPPTLSRSGLPHLGNSESARDYTPPLGSRGGYGDDRLELGAYSTEAREDFVAFCQSINPTGDMRRVVVAAEAANRFFGLDGVHADEVGELFDLIGWRRANSFTQTIRNAARAKFGWMERIPGRSGRYAATNTGRSITLSG